MPIIQENPGWAQALAGILGTVGAVQGAKNKRKTEEAVTQRQSQLDALNAADVQSLIASRGATSADAAARSKREQATFDQEQSDRTAGAAFQSSLKPPPSSYTPEQTARYYRNRADKAPTKAERDAAERMAEQSELGYQRTSQGALNKARVTNILDIAPQEFKQRLASNEKMQKARLGAQYDMLRQRMDAAMARTNISAGNRGVASNLAMQRFIESHNFDEAVRYGQQQYNKAEAEYTRELNQNDAYRLVNPTGTKPPYDPQAPQPPQELHIVIDPGTGQPHTVPVNPPKPQAPQGGGAFAGAKASGSKPVGGTPQSRGGKMQHNPKTGAVRWVFPDGHSEPG